jgi:hypothetical protein
MTLMKQLKAEIGTWKAAKVLRAVTARLRKLPKDQAMSEQQFLDLVDEEIQRVLGNG